MNVCALNRVEGSKYLSLIYDCNIKWDIHVNSIIKKTKYLIFVFYKLEFVLTKQQLLQIYYGLFHSVAVYRIIGWGGLYNNTFDPLDRLQQQILKIIGISGNDPNRPLNIRQFFIMKALLYHYDELRAEYA